MVDMYHCTQFLKSQKTVFNWMVACGLETRLIDENTFPLHNLKSYVWTALNVCIHMHEVNAQYRGYLSIWLFHVQHYSQCCTAMQLQYTLMILWNALLCTICTAVKPIRSYLKLNPYIPLTCGACEMVYTRVCRVNYYICLHLILSDGLSSNNEIIIKCDWYFERYGLSWFYQRWCFRYWICLCRGVKVNLLRGPATQSPK
jgi:hypothetical protein